MDFVATDAAPKAIGPYSQAVKANGLVYTYTKPPREDGLDAGRMSY